MNSRRPMAFQLDVCRNILAVLVLLCCCFTATSTAVGSTNNSNTSGVSTSSWFCGNVSAAALDHNRTGMTHDEIVQTTFEIEIVGYSISMCANIALLTFILLRQKRGVCSKHYNFAAADHIIGMAVFSMILSICYFCSGFVNFRATHFSKAACLTQASFIQFSLMGFLLEVGAIAFMSHKCIFELMSLDDLYTKYRPRVFSVVLGIAVFVTLLPLVVQLASQDTIPIVFVSHDSRLCWLEDCIGALITFVVCVFVFVGVYSAYLSIKTLVYVVGLFRHRRGMQRTTVHIFVIRRLVFVLAVFVIVVVVGLMAAVTQIGKLNGPGNWESTAQSVGIFIMACNGESSLVLLFLSLLSQPTIQK